MICMILIPILNTKLKEKIEQDNIHSFISSLAMFIPFIK